MAKKVQTDDAGDGKGDGGREVGDHAVERRLEHVVERDRQPGDQGDESKEPGQRRQLQRQVVGDRRQPPGAAAVGEKRSAQAQHEGQEHAEAHRRLGQARALRSPVAGAFQPVPGQGERQSRDQDVGQHGQESQQRAPQPSDRNGARHQPGQAAFGQPEADSHHGQHRQGAEQKLGRGRAVERARHPGLELAGQGAQAVLIALPLRADLVPEDRAQGRVGALEQLRLEHRPPLRKQFGAALLRIDRHQAGQPDVGVEGGALLLQGSALPRDIGAFGVAAGNGCRPEFAQACVEVGQLAGARGHEAICLRHDIVGEAADRPQLLLGIGRLGYPLRQRAQGLQRDVRRCRLRHGRLRARDGAQRDDDQEGRDATDHRAHGRILGRRATGRGGSRGADHTGPGTRGLRAAVLGDFLPLDFAGRPSPSWGERGLDLCSAEA
jgi:hypothetical protein